MTRIGVLPAARLRPPRASFARAPRPRLERRLEAGLVRRLTLLHAPAGFGKTTLVAEWAKQSEALVAWLQLAPEDDAPVRLVGCVAAALRTVRPGLSPEADALLAGQAAEPALSLLRALVLEPLGEPERPIALVLDDLHNLSSEASLSLLQALVEESPAGLHVVVTTRRLPPWPLARWEARDDAQRIEAAQLRLDEAESDAAVRGLLGAPLAREALRAVRERTEGWAAATLLCARAVAAGRRTSGAADAFVDEELLAGLPAETLPLLESLALVDAPTPALVEGLLRGSGSDEVRRALLRESVLVSEADREGPRLHALLRERLLARLEARPGALQRARASVAAALEADGRPEEALPLARAAGDEARVAVLTERLALAAICRSQLPTAARLLDEAPAAAREARPFLLVLDGWVRALSHDPAGHAELPHLLARLAALPREPEREAHAVALEALATLDRLDLSRAGVQLEEALARCPVEAELPRSVLHLARGTIATTIGDDATAQRELVAAERAARRSGNLFGAIAALAARGASLAARGALGEATARLEEGARWAAAEGCDEAGLGGHLRLLEAALALEQGRLGAALEGAARAERLARPLGDPVVLGWAAQVRHRAARLTGDVVARDEARARLERLASTGFPPVQRWLAAANAWRALDEGALAQEVMQADGWDEATLVSLRLARRDGRPTRDQAEALLARARSRGRFGEALDWQLAVALASGRPEALRGLGEAVAAARAEGHVRPFLETREEWTPLLGALPPSVGAFLAALSPPPPPKPAATPLPHERPTARELEVLARVALGETNEEIAAALSLSVGTVKTHLHRAADKLSAKNRATAARRARELGLLPPDGAG